MTFIALILGLLVASLWDDIRSIHQDDWFYRFSDWLNKLVLPEPLTVAVAVLAPWFVAATLMASLDSFLFGLGWIAAAIFLLVYSLGRGDFEEQARIYGGSVASGDNEGAWLHLREWFGLEQDSAPADARALQALAVRQIGYEGFQRQFAILFWFVVLGPAGALAYRLLQLHHNDRGGETSAKVLFVVDWVPSRLYALGFALTGDFLGSTDELGDAWSDPSMSASEVIASVGLAALKLPMPHDGVEDAEIDCSGYGDDIEELCALLSRSWMTWLAIWSVVVLLG